jgi:hypothetical protein
MQPNPTPEEAEAATRIDAQLEARRLLVGLKDYGITVSFGTEVSQTKLHDAEQIEALLTDMLVKLRKAEATAEAYAELLKDLQQKGTLVNV